MTATTIQQAAEKLRHSSAYAAGDRLTFKLVLEPGKLELPGQSDPAAYFGLVQQAFQYEMPTGARVAIVGAGYGGLAAHVLLKGAGHVVMIEPRFRFHAGLDAVCPLLDEIYAPEETETAVTFKAWPTMPHVDGLGQFDLVLAPEGFDECPDPVELLCAMVAMTKAGGLCALEVTIGETEQVPAGKVNSWKPTEAAFGQLLKLSGLSDRVRQCNGRGTNRVLYGIPFGDVVKPTIATREYSEPMPRPGLPPTEGQFSQPRPLGDMARAGKADAKTTVPAPAPASPKPAEKEELLWDQETEVESPATAPAEPDPDYDAVVAAASAEFDLKPPESPELPVPESPVSEPAEEPIVLVDDSEVSQPDPEPESGGKPKKRKRSG